MVKNCIVAGAIVFNKAGDKVILLKHKKLGVWLQPGGHINEGEMPDEAAIREAMEETGLEIKLIDATPTVQTKFDAYAKRSPQPLLVMFEDVPYKIERHNHFDIVYLSQALGDRFIQNHESEELRWFKEDEIDELKTFKNVEMVLHHAFKVYKQIKNREN